MTIGELAFLSCRVMGALTFLWAIRMLPLVATTFAQVSALGTDMPLSRAYDISAWASAAAVALYFIASGVLWSCARSVSDWFVPEERAQGSPLDISNVTRLGIMLLGLYTVLSYAPSVVTSIEIFIGDQRTGLRRTTGLEVGANLAVFLIGLYLLIGPGRLKRFWYLSGDSPSTGDNTP